jgi:hypothetical protein
MALASLVYIFGVEELSVPNSRSKNNGGVTTASAVRETSAPNPRDRVMAVYQLHLMRRKCYRTPKA